MNEYLFMTESYPFSTALGVLLDRPDERYVLITRNVHETLDAGDLARFAAIVVVEDFALDTLAAALERAGAGPGARIVSHDDFFYAAFAALNRRYGLTGYSLESIQPFVDKQVMKQRLEGSGLRLPRWQLFRPEEHAADPARWRAQTIAALGMPVFAKPTQGAGAEHAALLDSIQALEAWAHAPRPAGLVFELDEFIAGATLYHCDSVLQGQRAVFTEVACYSNPCADFAGGRAVGSRTLADDDPARAPLIAFTDAVFAAFARHAPIPDGVTHMELFRRDDGEIIFLEVHFRPPGANVRQAYAERLGVNLEHYHLALQMGRTIAPIAARGDHAAWLYFPTADGTVADVHPLPPLRSRVIAADYGVAPGSVTQAPLSILDARGRGVVALSLVIAHPDADVLREDFERLAAYRPYRMA